MGFGLFGPGIPKSQIWYPNFGPREPNLVFGYLVADFFTKPLQGNLFRMMRRIVKTGHIENPVIDILVKIEIDIRLETSFQSFSVYVFELNGNPME